MEENGGTIRAEDIAGAFVELSMEEKLNKAWDRILREQEGHTYGWWLAELEQAMKRGMEKDEN